MENSMTRILIETVAKKALHDVKDSPERGMRNLIDLALQFSGGRFQRRFFEVIQTLLKNENSAYYILIRDVIANVNEDQLLNFGMVLGYNSCTLGAKKIRQNEKDLDCNIPWAVRLHIHPEIFQQHQSQYFQLIQDGNQLGIYTWILFAQSHAETFLQLADAYTDNCFLLFCKPDEITEEFVNAVSSRDNLMAVVCCNNDASEACLRLRKAGILFSVYYMYSEKDLHSIENCSLFYMVQELHPLFSVFVAQPDCPDAVQKRVSQTIQTTRKEQQYRTILLEMDEDNRLVDKIISDDACSVCFSSDGMLYQGKNGSAKNDCNLFTSPLQEILQKALPKNQNKYVSV